MVTKISLGKSLYGALAYNGEKINKEQGRLLATNRIFNDGSGTVDIAKAMEGFLAFMPATVRTEKPVLHISINPHPDDVLTDTELQEIAREYLDRLGYGNQPYMMYKHEDIDRHHLHIVTINIDESGRRLNQDFLFRRSERIRKDLERKYGLHPAERRGERIERPLHKVDVAAGDVKKQVGNIVKAVNRQYRFQSLGEYRALLSLYNVTVEETRGIVRGREYHGLVFSATDDAGNRTGNPFKSSLFGKSAGYEALQNKFARSKKEIKDRKLAETTKLTYWLLWRRLTIRAASSPCSGKEASTRCCDIRRTGAFTALPSSTTARAACSTAHAWAGDFRPMPCRNTSRCHSATTSR